MPSRSEMTEGESGKPLGKTHLSCKMEGWEPSPLLRGHLTSPALRRIVPSAQIEEGVDLAIYIKRTR